jgi:hypothetical protein
MKLACGVENCDEDVPEGTGSKGGDILCPKHRSAGYRAKSKGIGWIKERRKTLMLWNSSYDYFEPRIRKLTSNAKKAVDEAKARARVALARRGGRQSAALH